MWDRQQQTLMFIHSLYIPQRYFANVLHLKVKSCHTMSQVVSGFILIHSWRILDRGSKHHRARMSRLLSDQMC